MRKFLTLSIVCTMLVGIFGFVEKTSADFSTMMVAENTAQFNDDFTIVLDESQPISSTYVADISHFKANMPNKVEAEKFISNFSRSYIQISLDLNASKAYVNLERNEKTASWTVAQWNQNLKLK